ncbi:hypothetical protein SODALDRAFT_358287 [Sodiomyces alkalinus F11]|uniref:Uncharacterized protein n=1 Tax=Sodiomyces alkalinus (strain CBS 110278 / VKM F-3762 / F11) TaxID=1314773 RepID=A0A3N2PZC2_SODAK|nr:hypothetical protein SODALDRAFT_358287 [Sodiomyces alkalinus F11]ROT39873.1 hypothetical protein SODALDRAFT_358287 [Sodiomyces alkalinus F11]
MQLAFPIAKTGAHSKADEIDDCLVAKRLLLHNHIVNEVGTAYSVQRTDTSTKLPTPSSHTVPRLWTHQLVIFGRRGRVLKRIGRSSSAHPPMGRAMTLDLQPIFTPPDWLMTPAFQEFHNPSIDSTFGRCPCVSGFSLPWGRRIMPSLGILAHHDK